MTTNNEKPIGKNVLREILDKPYKAFEDVQRFDFSHMKVFTGSAIVGGMFPKASLKLTGSNSPNGIVKRGCLPTTANMILMMLPE